MLDPVLFALWPLEQDIITFMLLTCKHKCCKDSVLLTKKRRYNKVKQIQLGPGTSCPIPVEVEKALK